MNAAALIADALGKAELCPADVRKAALLRISRVQTVVSPDRAQRTLDLGLAENPGLRDSHQLGFEQLSLFAIAAVDPQRLSQLSPKTNRSVLHDVSNRLVRAMIEHGHENYLRTYVLHDAPLADVPFDGIRHLLVKAGDDNERQFLLRRAAEVWRAQTPSSRSGGRQNQFHTLFRAWWKVLPRAEALATLREIIEGVVEKPDPGVYGRIEDAQFTSVHALEIFQNFDLLLELDPEYSRQLAGAHPELATSLERYPMALQSIQKEAEAARAKMPPPDPSQKGYFVMGGGHDEFDYGRALLDAEDPGDFAKPLEYAGARYQEDSDQKNMNGAPKAFWPSGAIYQTIFYRMGKTLGQAAELKLDRIPDAELRLFAQIELAAALCGLPELATMTQRLPIHRQSRDR